MTRGQKNNKAGTVCFEGLEGRTMMSGTGLTISTATYLGSAQLRINGTSGDDKITIKRNSAGLVIGNTGGWTKTVAGSFKTIVINAGAGNDIVAIDSSVTRTAIIYGGSGNDTLTGGAGNDRIYGQDGNDRTNGGAGNDVIVNVGGGALDTLAGGTGADSFWADTTDAITDATSEEIVSGSVHRVGGFLSYNIKSGGKCTTIGVTKEPKGQNLADPTVTDGSFTYKNFSSNPLFGDAGPSADDVTQGQVGDCYFLSVLSSVAKVDAGLIRQTIADLGDGTFAVQFVRDGKPVFVRVDADLATYSWGSLAYANLGAQGSLWVAVMEKAFAYFRSSEGTYSSIEAGWMSEAYSALGKNCCETYTTSGATSLMNAINSAFLAGKSVTYAVSNPCGGASLVGGHAYMVDSVTKDANGNVIGLRLRNPWGIDGAGNDGKNDGYVTITASQAFGSFLGMTTANV